MSRTRWGSAALALAGVLFILYPALRPWHDESTQEGAVRSMGSGAWVASHAFAMVGFVLVTLGLLALCAAVAATPARRLALAALVIAWLGAGLTLPYYGAEDFGLHAAATKAPGTILEVADATRYNPVAVTMFGAGLILLGVGAVLAAIAVWRCGALPRYSGILFGLGFALFLPQFFTTPAIRIAHGILLGTGCAWLALGLWRARVAGATPSREGR